MPNEPASDRVGNRRRTTQQRSPSLPPPTKPSSRKPMLATAGKPACACDVGLNNGDQVAEHHRQGSNHGEGSPTSRPPLSVRPPPNRRYASAKVAAFGAVPRNSVMAVGAPL